MLADIIENWKLYCDESNFVGIGSTRKAHRIADYVVKTHVHPIGYKQSKRELDIYNVMMQKGLANFFAQTYYVDESISVPKYYQPVDMVDNQSFEINTKKNLSIIPKRYDEVLDLLD